MKKIFQLLSAIMLLMLASCVSRPDSEIFFTCKKIKSNSETLFGCSYPRDFSEINSTRFQAKDVKFYLLYFNKREDAACSVRIFSANGRCTGVGKTFLIRNNSFLYQEILLQPLIAEFGYGKYRAKLIRNEEAIMSLDFQVDESP